MSQQLFTFRSPVRQDPIFRAAARAKAAGKDCINGTIGILLDEEANPLILDSTKNALKQSSEHVLYSPLQGVPEYLACVRDLVMVEPTTPCVATVGGTGALSVLLRFAAQAQYRNVMIPLPSWPNHIRIVEDAGYNAETRDTFDAMIEALRKTDVPTIALVQGSCHNPTGVVITDAQWQELADALTGSPHAVLVDCAYQGLGSGLKEDIRAVPILQTSGVPVMVAWSASKNHTIYGLRTGAALVLSGDDTMTERLKMAQRSLVSQAPVTGQHVVATVQTHYRDLWEQELHEIRSMLSRKRAVLVDALDLPAETEGLFLQLPLSEAQIEQLIQKNIYLTPDGRVNLAGIPFSRMDALITGIQKIRESA